MPKAKCLFLKGKFKGFFPDMKVFITEHMFIH